MTSLDLLGRQGQEEATRPPGSSSPGKLTPRGHAGKSVSTDPGSVPGRLSPMPVVVVVESFYGRLSVDGLGAIPQLGWLFLWNPHLKEILGCVPYTL